ncbi:hypothetical protein Pla108_30930 [Botrimarina colliarenosi]|uniref:IRE (Iron responsive element) n=1 Tax=Botrimarina colliarenosi TaxID=2528001 RepID=A0A5C6ACM1_9BACT|nr:hypothetical protein [Botrimarina colliarenosi]TWT96013.1 hypothetical protein Pla108_30930 [Botrimarina colliarenosi]
MNRRSSFYRKVTYGVVIAALLFPLSLLSAPATVDSKGGKLAQLRAENGLSQAGLGEIDPASETIKLATLGLRGLAVQFLWNNANHYKKVEDWTNLTATLEQLAKLQPNFITFWKFQSWNLSYNVSVEFDDYHDRYYWVRRGIQFLEEGLNYNRDNPTLQWEHGWVLGQKIGRADEKVQYRRLFKTDDEYHPVDRPPAERDNWLVSKKAYLDSVRSVDELGKSLGKKSPAIFYSSAPKSQMNYAEAIEDEGLFDTAVAAWKLAGQDWREFGNIPIEHSTGKILVFNDEEYLQGEVERLRAELEGIADGLRAEVEAEARAQLTEEQKVASETDPSKLTEEQTEAYYEAKQILEVTPAKLAAKAAELAPEKAREAKEIAAELMEKELLTRYIHNYKDTTNYDYWALRCAFEQSKPAVAARSLLYRARRQFLEEADPVAAKALYEEAFDRWAEVFEEFPKLKDGEGTTGDDVMVFITEYNDVLEQLDEEVPEDFPLWEIIENFDSEQVFQLQLRERRQRLGAIEQEDAAESVDPSTQSVDPEASDDGAEQADQDDAAEADEVD